MTYFTFYFTERSRDERKTTRIYTEDRVIDCDIYSTANERKEDYGRIVPVQQLSIDYGYRPYM